MMLVLTKFSNSVNSCFILYLLVRSAAMVRYWRIGASWFSVLKDVITAHSFFWYSAFRSFSSSVLWTKKQLNASSTDTTLCNNVINE